jgi:hypothetical protein
VTVKRPPRLDPTIETWKHRRRRAELARKAYREREMRGSTPAERRAARVEEALNPTKGLTPKPKRRPVAKKLQTAAQHPAGSRKDRQR